MDEESQPETSIGKGETETDEAEGSTRGVDKNESSIDEKGDETKNSATGEGETETVREKQVDEDVTKYWSLIQDENLRFSLEDPARTPLIVAKCSEGALSTTEGA